MFRKVSQALGATMILFGLYRIVLTSIAMCRGEMQLGWGIFAIVTILCVGCGFGILLLMFDPKSIILSGGFKLHELVKPRERKSFAERIRAGEDD